MKHKIQSSLTTTWLTSRPLTTQPGGPEFGVRFRLYRYFGRAP